MQCTSYNTTQTIQQQYTNFSIAFKPAESGWGSGSKYTNNYDNIFKSSKKKKKEEKKEKQTISKNSDDQHVKMEEGDRWRSFGFDCVERIGLGL